MQELKLVAGAELGSLRRQSPAKRRRPSPPECRFRQAQADRLLFCPRRIDLVKEVIRNIQV